LQIKLKFKIESLKVHKHGLNGGKLITLVTYWHSVLAVTKRPVNQRW